MSLPHRSADGEHARADGLERLPAVVLSFQAVDLLHDSGNTELLIIDETDRLKIAGLEQVRDFSDRHRMGVIIIGMPGIEIRLARYPQLYSRIGFAHGYRPLRSDELTAVVAQRLPKPDLEDGDLAHTAALAAIVRATSDRTITDAESMTSIGASHSGSGFSGRRLS